MKFLDVLWIAPLVLLGPALLITLRREESNRKLAPKQEGVFNTIPTSEYQPPSQAALEATSPSQTAQTSESNEPNETQTTHKEIPIEAHILEGARIVMEEGAMKIESSTDLATNLEQIESTSVILQIAETQPSPAVNTTEQVTHAAAVDGIGDVMTDAETGLKEIPTPEDSEIEKLSVMELIPSMEAETELATNHQPTSTNSSSIATLDAAPVAEPNSSSSMATPASSLPAIIPVDYPLTSLSSEAFQRAFTANLLQVLGKSVETATPTDHYTILAWMVRARLLQFDPEAQLVTSKTRIVGQVATHFRVRPYLETHLFNLGIVEPIYQGLQALGLRLVQLYDQEELTQPANPNLEEDLGEWTGSRLDSLTTANLPAIGYGIFYKDSTPEPIRGDRADESVQPISERIEDHNPWHIEKPNIKYEISFGGYTDAHIDQQGRYRKQWIAQETLEYTACDILISGFDASTVNILRLWKASTPEATVLLSVPLSTQKNAAQQNEEIRLKQCFLLASCTIQDVLRLHLATKSPLETLPDRWNLQLNDTAPVLAIAELMYQLVDRHNLDWERAWETTQRTFSCTFYSLMPNALGERWTISLLGRLLPRHLEIIYEINRRLLESAQSIHANDQTKVAQLSLIEEIGDHYFRQRYLRTSHLAYAGSHQVSGANSFHLQTIQRILPLFSELYPNRLSHRVSGITPRRFLLQSNPRLANLITEWIDDQWMTDPLQLSKLEPLVNNAEFCGSWWQVKRDNKQSLTDQIQSRTGLAVNLNSLFEVQAAPVHEAQRQLLSLLHVITLYARIKINSSTDTMLRFAHRSVPRTVIFVGQPQPQSQFAGSIVQLIQAVANTVNNDAEMQGRLQVIYLADESFQLARRLYAATDLFNYIPLAGQAAPSTIPMRFALNGSILLGTPNSIVAEIRQTIGAKNLFQFGLTATEANTLQPNYAPMQHYSADSELQQVIKLIASGQFSQGDESTFRTLGNWLLTEDPQLVLAEYPDYISTQERISQAYQDQRSWTWMSILSTTQMGQLSADRAISGSGS